MDSVLLGSPEATPRALAALGCRWLDLWCLRSPRATIAYIEVSAEGYTIAYHDGTAQRLAHGWSGGTARVTAEDAGAPGAPDAPTMGEIV